MRDDHAQSKTNARKAESRKLSDLCLHSDSVWVPSSLSTWSYGFSQRQSQCFTATNCFLVGSYIALNDLALLILLPLPTGCWEYRNACMLCPVPTVPRVKVSAWYMLGRWAVTLIFWSQLLTERLSSPRCPRWLAWETLTIHTCKYLRGLVESHIFCLNDRDSSLCNMQRL